MKKKTLECSHSRTMVIDVRSVVGGTRRRRECLICEKRFTTMELVVDAQRGIDSLEVLKKQYGKALARDLLAEVLITLEI